MNSIPIKEALTFLTPEQHTIISAMMLRANMHMDNTAQFVFDEFISHQNLNKDELLAIVSLMGVTRQKYAPKLNFDKRCEILALYSAGFSRETLSKAYRVDRRTITHIYTETSPHYKSVRDLYNGIGKDAFMEKFLTPSVIQYVLSFQATSIKEVNNKFANAKQGLHTVRGPNCNYDHRVVIQWVEAGTKNIQVSGWYYRDLDSDFPEDWFTAGSPESLRNSQACFSAMLGDITDRLE